MNQGYFSGARATIRVGLVGCGGRGTGAARDCVASSEGVVIHAMGDLFADRLEESRKLLQEHIGDRLEAPAERCFSGFDAYRQVIDSGVDVVILATPPGFRPIHLRAAVEAGKHVFMEKPAGVDPAGVRSVIESGELARQKNLSIVAGTQYRRQPSFVEAIRRIHDGVIGDLVGGEEYYLTGPIWLRPRQAGMSDMEWQCRNWYYFTWLSGDHIVEQFVHNLDAFNWAFQGPPVRCLATGGRQQRVDPSFGHIYDHFLVDYEYPNGARVMATCRQMENATTRVSNRFVGTRGVAHVNPDSSQIRSLAGEVIFRHPEKGNNPYVQEHADLIASIRNGQPLNEAKEVADSTLTAIMARESAYTGLEITWDEISRSGQNLVPKHFAFEPRPFPPVPMPGQTKLERPA